MIYAEGIPVDDTTFVVRTRDTDTSADEYTAINRATGITARGASLRAATNTLRCRR